MNEPVSIVDGFGRAKSRRAFLAGLAAAAAGVGCSGPPSPTEDHSETATRLRVLLQHLTDFIAETNRLGTRPATEEKFKKYLDALPKARLDMDKVGDVRELLVSPRDQQPFVIRYDIPLGGPVPAIWERHGVEGRRYVIFVDDALEEADAARCQQLKLR